MLAQSLRRSFLIFLFLVFVNFDLDARSNENAKAIAIEERNYKEAIKLQIAKITALKGSDIRTRKEISEHLYELSLLYLKDQDQELGFKTFLEALELAGMSKEEKFFDASIYDKAFTIYIDPSSTSPQETAKRLLDLLTPYLKEQPNETLLEFYLSIAFANLGKYEDFLYHFYRAYKSYPDHYLAYKTKAILYAKVLEREGEEKKRENLRKAIVNNLTLSLSKEPRDTTIYKLIISFADNESKSKEINQCLNKILKANIIIPRTDLLFYVHAAVSANEKDLAANFVKRSREWYPSSRLVDAAEQYLNAHKGASCNE